MLLLAGCASGGQVRGKVVVVTGSHIALRQFGRQGAADAADGSRRQGERMRLERAQRGQAVAGPPSPADPG